MCVEFIFLNQIFVELILRTLCLERMKFAATKLFFNGIFVWFDDSFFTACFLFGTGNVRVFDEFLLKLFTC